MERPVGKKITSVNPLEGVASFFGAMSKPAQGNITTEVGDITIDTCLPSDTGVWETGIQRESVEGKWIIVSQYESDLEATIEHEKWVELMRNEPTCKLKDIDNWNLDSLRQD